MPGLYTAHRAKLSRAFTLLELMMVVGLLSVLASLAIGYSGSYASDQRVKQTARGAQAVINLARAYAVRNSKTVKVAFGNSQFTAFIDMNNDGVYNDGEPRIYQYPENNLSLAPTTVTFVSSVTQGGNPLPIQLNNYGQPFLSINFEGLSFSAARNTLMTMVLCVSDTASDEVRAVQMTATSTCRIFSGQQAKNLGCGARVHMSS